MSRFREFAPGVYAGEKLFLPDLKRKAERKKLIGKRIGYDQRGSCMMHYGWVTGEFPRALEVNGSVMDLCQFDQIVILADQG